MFGELYFIGEFVSMVFVDLCDGMLYVVFNFGYFGVKLYWLCVGVIDWEECVVLVYLLQLVDVLFVCVDMCVGSGDIDDEFVGLL